MNDERDRENSDAFSNMLRGLDSGQVQVIATEEPGIELPADMKLDGFPHRTHDEVRATLRSLAKLSEQFYWLCFRANISTWCHPFMEFNGLITDYINACRDAARQGVDFSKCSVHTGVALPMTKHQAQYIAEKLNCIFGPAIRNDRAVAAIFRKTLGL